MSEYLPPEWGVDQSHPQLHDSLIEMLSSVTDPELGYSILDLGLVRDVSINDGKGKIVMILTSPYCPYGPSMLEEARKSAEQALGLPTEVEFSPQRWVKAMMDPELQDELFGFM